MGYFVLFACLASVPTCALGALFAWGRWLKRRTAAPRWSAWLGNALLVLGAVSTLGSVVVGVRLFAAMGRTNSPADRSRAMASAIAELFYNQAVTALIGFVTVVWLLVATWRWHWRRPRARSDVSPTRTSG